MKSIKNNLAFRVVNFRKLDNWKILDVDLNVPFTVNENCPSDDTPMRVIAVVAGREGAQLMRLGCCQYCGFVGFIDRPTREWIDKFYLDVWDSAQEKQEQFDKAVKKAREKILLGKERTNNAATIITALNLPLKKDTPILELGCGDGSTMNGLKKIGFTCVVGNENSQHRAEVARKAFGSRVFTGAFESKEVQNKLDKFAPFGLIYSHHVFEHVYDPREIMQKCARLQNEGGYFIISLPNIRGEFTLSRLLYLPHLGSFSKFSLSLLLQKYGYEVIDSSLSTRRELCIVAKKKAKVLKPEPEEKDYFKYTLHKFVSYLGLEKPVLTKEFMWCLRSVDVAGRLPFFSNRYLIRVLEIFASRVLPYWYWGKITSALGFISPQRPRILSLVIAPVIKRYIAPEHIPIEIQFERDIQLSYK